MALAALPGTVGAETVKRAGMVISFAGGITPKELPRQGAAPVDAHFQGKVRSADGGELPRLERLAIQINRHAKLTTRGLPVCPFGQIRNTRTDTALENCPGSVVGKGRFGVRLSFPDQEPIYAKGRVTAFHSRLRGMPAILVHVFTKQPVAVSITVPLTIKKRDRGDYGFVLRSPSLPKLLGRHIYTTDFAFSLGRMFGTGPDRRSYLSAACPAPTGLPGAIFNLARATYSFDDGRKVTETLTRNCRVSQKTEQGRGKKR